jgi:hypothetical protein
MHITAAAYTGSPGASTISLLLSISGQTAIALADTGSTNTFLDYNFAVKHNIAMQPAPSRTVTVAGGGTLISEWVARHCKFSIEGKPFQADFRVLKLQGSDIILGVNWFKEHNPVTFDFVARTLSLSLKGKTHSFSDHLIPAQKLIISAEECSKLIDNGATGYILLSATDADTATKEQHLPPVPALLEEIVTQFQDIFSAPQGMPPHKSTDHCIPLIPGATPPNIRPYRMSHNQKNIIEAIIKEMPHNEEIQPSSSPFSSLVILVKKKDKS